MDDDERFQLAANAAQRIATQCRNHVRSSLGRVAKRLETASKSSPYGIDKSAAGEGRHAVAWQQRTDHVNKTSKALLAQLEGLVVLLEQERFHLLPAISVVRSIAEISASCAWMLDSTIDSDERAARSYAAVFQWIEVSISETLEDDARSARQSRENLVTKLKADGVQIKRREKDGRAFDDVAQITVGRAHAKVRFNYTQRVDKEIPEIAGTYSALSGIVHGGTAYIAASWQTPDTFARLIGIVTLRSVEAWSRHVHTWVGIETATFINEQDFTMLIRSWPRDVVEGADSSSRDA